MWCVYIYTHPIYMKYVKMLYTFKHTKNILLQDRPSKG